MPRFFFHVHDGATDQDEDGTELPDLTAARKEAVRLAGELLVADSAKFWDEEHWSIDIADELGLVLFTLTFFATHAPATPPPRVRA